MNLATFVKYSVEKAKGSSVPVFLLARLNWQARDGKSMSPLMKEAPFNLWIN